MSLFAHLTDSIIFAMLGTFNVWSFKMLQMIPVMISSIKVITVLENILLIHSNFVIVVPEPWVRPAQERAPCWAGISLGQFAGWLGSRTGAFPCLLRRECSSSRRACFCRRTWWLACSQTYPFPFPWGQSPTLRWRHRPGQRSRCQTMQSNDKSEH